MSHICPNPRCQEQFQSVSTLNRHVRNIHHEKGFQVQENKTFECHDCGKCYRTRESLMLHWRRAHRIRKNDENKCKTTTRRCPICKSDFPSKEITSHFVDDHNLAIEEETRVFPDEKSFKKWKSKTEANTSSKFILNYLHNNRTIRMYGCHRSGFLKQTSRGIRRQKTQGSRKINAYCPAALRFEKSNNGIQVKYIKTHIGHLNELCHLDISPTKKKEIAVKLMQNIPKRAILQDIRRSCTGEMKREHLVKMKDIDNVASKYNVGSKYSSKFKLHSIDADSIDMTIDDLIEEDCSFVQLSSIPTNETDVSQKMTFSNTRDEVIIVDLLGDDVTDFDCQDAGVENDLSSSIAVEGSITEEHSYPTSKMKEKDVGILFRTILKKLQTEEEVTSLYKTLEQFQKRLEISRRMS